jgi:hypothetical protein
LHPSLKRCIFPLIPALSLRIKKTNMSKKDYEPPILPDVFYVQLEDSNYREGPELEYVAYVELHAPPDTSPPTNSTPFPSGEGRGEATIVS